MPKMKRRYTMVIHTQMLTIRMVGLDLLDFLHTGVRGIISQQVKAIFVGQTD